MERIDEIGTNNYEFYFDTKRFRPLRSFFPNKCSIKLHKLNNVFYVFLQCKFLSGLFFHIAESDMNDICLLYFLMARENLEC